MSDSDPVALGTGELAAAAVTHLQRIVDRKAALLLKDRDPSDTGCLHGMVHWLFQQIGAPETQFRRKCMQLFMSLSPHVTSTSSSDNTPAQQWVARYIGTSGLDALIALVEPNSTGAPPPAIGSASVTAVRVFVESGKCLLVLLFIVTSVVLRCLRRCQTG